MSRGELLGLTSLALDLNGGTLRIDQQLVPTRGGVTFGAPKAKRSRRTIAIAAETVEALKAHREAQLLERTFAATPTSTNGVPINVVAARIGDRPETVLRVYAHLLPQSDVEAVEQVAALIA